MTKTDFAKWAKAKRVAAGLSHTQVKMLTSRNTKDVERGKHNPSFTLLQQLGRLYGVPDEEWIEVWLHHVIGDDIKLGGAAAVLAESLRGFDAS